MDAGSEKKENKKPGQMRIPFPLILIVFLVALSGCSNTRFLTHDQMLYTGRNKVEIINSHQVKKTSPVKSYVKSVTNHKVNNSLFGRRVLPPVNLWIHNYMKPKENKKLGHWLYKTFSSSPVLISSVNPDLRAQKIENELFDIGYFNTKAWAVVDTNARNHKKARVSYFVDLTPPFHYKQIIYNAPVDPVDTLINQIRLTDEIKAGEQFNLAELKSARQVLSRKVQESGYYFFIPEFIENKVDTTIGGNQMNLMIGKKRDLPPSVLTSYTINNIILSISKSSKTDSSTPDTNQYKDITIISDGVILKPDVLINAVYFRTGETYSYTAYQRTMNHLNNLGVFRYVNVLFKQAGSDSLLPILDVQIDILVADNISVDFDANLVTKSTGFSGPAFSTGISHGNTFKGAEKLQIRLNGGIEWQWGGDKTATQLGTYSYELGVNSGLTFPKIMVPFKLKSFGPLMTQHTAVNLGFNILNRTAYYRMYSTQAGLNYQWGPTKELQHTFYPLYLNSVKLLETTAEFDSVVYDNIYIRKSFEEQYIFGVKYDFSYNNSFHVRPNNFFFQAGIISSCYLIDLVARNGNESSERPYHMLGKIYSQFVKLTTDFRYYRNGFSKNFVFRLYAGIGIPYGNSTALPYVEQFFSGGAYSIRGFTARNLGPGSFHEDTGGYIDQSGDLKLESNFEYRFKMSKTLNGALFIETGNIWLLNEDENRPGAEFHLNTFYKQLAVGTGVGLRFDFTFFVFRADLGFPLRTPYTVDNRYWLFGSGEFLSHGLFYLAIGYPF
jgi:outer membrane protein assembly factor BamA